MRLFLLIAPIFIFVSCQMAMPPAKEKPLSEQQKHFHSLIREIRDCYELAGNAAKKRECIDSYKDKIDRFFKDTSEGVLIKFYVKVRRVSFLPWQSKTALLLDANDDKVEYWMEQHFDDEKLMKESGLYKLVSGLKEDQDTTLSFVYFFDLEVEMSITGGDPEIKVRVFPIQDSLIPKYIESG